jgi:hypothetical protein
VLVLPLCTGTRARATLEARCCSRAQPARQTLWWVEAAAGCGRAVQDSSPDHAMNPCHPLPAVWDHLLWTELCTRLSWGVHRSGRRPHTDSERHSGGSSRELCGHAVVAQPIRWHMTAHPAQCRSCCGRLLDWTVLTHELQHGSCVEGSDQCICTRYERILMLFFMLQRASTTRGLMFAPKQTCETKKCEVRNEVPYPAHSVANFERSSSPHTPGTARREQPADTQDVSRLWFPSSRPLAALPRVTTRPLCQQTPERSPGAVGS